MTKSVRNRVNREEWLPRSRCFAGHAGPAEPGTIAWNSTGFLMRRSRYRQEGTSSCPRPRSLWITESLLAALLTVG